MKTKKISIGHYEMNGYHISAYYGTISTVWNIFNDRDLMDEVAVGFNSKKEAMEFIAKNLPIK